MHLRESRISKFPGGPCPQTPLGGNARRALQLLLNSMQLLFSKVVKALTVLRVSRRVQNILKSLVICMGLFLWHPGLPSSKATTYISDDTDTTHKCSTLLRLPASTCTSICNKRALAFQEQNKLHITNTDSTKRYILRIVS